MHWNGTTGICKGEYVTQGAQHAGGSGSAVVNGCGYVGMAHAVGTSSDKIHFAALVPTEAIRTLMAKNIHTFSIAEDCNITPLIIPRATYVSCDGDR